MRYMMLILGLSLISISCSKNSFTRDGGGDGKSTLAATSYMDVSYGTDGLQTMDVYLPAQRSTSTRLLIIIHGGGWTAGDKSDFNNYITEFQKRLPGYAFANVNYRLVTEKSNHFPAQEDDIKSAIEYLKGKTGDYHISSDFIYLGISAGAHLALLQAYKHSDVIQPKGIVSFFGPVDLHELYLHSDATIPTVLKTIMGATLAQNPDIFQQESPINFVSAHSAPTLMLHGDKDVLVPIEQAYLLRNKLNTFNVPNQLIVYPGQGHGWIGPDLTDSFDKVEKFVKGL